MSNLKTSTKQRKQLKTWKDSLQKRRDFPDVIKNIECSWKELKTLTGVWKKQIPTHMDDFEKFKASVQEIPADELEIAREPEFRRRA